MRDRTRAILLLAGCCAATFALKLWANASRISAGHGDTPYYFHVAQNLFAGRGFVCDYVWSFLENPSGAVPAPSNGWWMPGPSVVAFVGMWFAGEATFEAAKVAMSAFTSLYPIVVWWTAWALFRDRTLAARAAVLSVAFHLFLDQPAAPLSHGPYGMIVGAALVLLSAAPLTTRRGLVFGVLVGLAHLFRGDALTLFGTAGVLAVVAIRRQGWRASARPLGVAVAAYVVVMSPWFVRNVQVYGTPMPPGPSKALWLRDYPEWFALPDRLVPRRYFAEGVGVRLGEKADQTAKSAWTYVASYFDPTIEDRSQWVDASPGALLGSLAKWLRDENATFHDPEPPPWYLLRPLGMVMAGLTFAGLARLVLRTLRSRRRGDDPPLAPRWLGVFGLHSFAELAFYAWLFTGVANQSYVSSMYALYPLFVVGMAACLEPPRALAARVPRIAATGAWAAVLALAALNALGGGAYLRQYKGPTISRGTAQWRSFGEELVKQGFRPQADRLMLERTWNLYAAFPISVVRLPDEPLDRILETAQRLGVQWLAIGDRPFDVGPNVRPYRLQVYQLLRDSERSWRVFRDAELGLNVVRIRPG